MKEYKIKMLPSAKSDLFDMVKYLSHFYKSTATKKYDMIIEKIINLKLFSLMYEEYKTTISDFTYQRMVVEDYLIFYVVINETVEIHNIINSKMDISKLI